MHLNFESISNSLLNYHRTSRRLYNSLVSGRETSEFVNIAVRRKAFQIVIIRKNRRDGRVSEKRIYIYTHFPPYPHIHEIPPDYLI